MLPHSQSCRITTPEAQAHLSDALARLDKIPVSVRNADDELWRLAVLALEQMRRFLAGPAPSVLSVSDRWGGGKSIGWNKVALQEVRNGAETELS